MNTKRTHTQRKLIAAVVIALLIVGAVILSVATTTRFHVRQAGSESANTLYVSTDGSDTNGGTTQAKPLKTIQKALEVAQPGTVIELADGTYAQAVTTVRDGTKEAPITIHGGRGAVLTGKPDKGRIVEVHHDYIQFEGFTINGQIGAGTSKDDFHDKLLYAIGTGTKSGVQGMKITNMLIENAGGECVRLRYFATDNEISQSTIRNCGIWDFRFHDGGKNGEGIYIGTAPEQRPDGKNPTADIDVSTRNHIHHNQIETNGNECVDIKEGAVQNLVEYNTCWHQKDPDSGGFDSRGEYNVFRFNTIKDNEGAGVRLGGDSETNGIHNDVYGNTISNNRSGTLKIQRMPQGKICDNTVQNNGGDGTEDSEGIDPSQKCE